MTHTGSGGPPPARYRPRPGLVETEIPGELVLLDPETQEMFSLNETGRAAWRLLPGRTLREVAEGMCGRFEATPEAVLADLEALVAQLLAAGLLLAEEEPE
jgi:hypothetical protein